MRNLCLLVSISECFFLCCAISYDRIFLTVDGVPLRFYLRDTTEYESRTYYQCAEGQIVDLICSKFQNYGRLKLKYYDQNGTKMVETDEVGSKDTLNFRLLARAENHQSYVDCIHIDDTRHNRTEFTYRVIFMIVDKNRNNSNLIITINGIEITSLAAYAKDDDIYDMTYRYHYKFLYSDTLNITCENNSFLLAYISYKNIVSDIFPSFEMDKSVDFKQTQSLYSPYVQVYLVETKYLDRATMVFNFSDSTETKIYKATIKFDMDDRHDPIILGLTQSNILYQYNKSAMEWFIHYQYRVHEVLNLTCVVKKNSFLQWIYGENIVLPVLFNVAYGTSYVSYEFHTDNETKEIICETRSVSYGAKRTTIVLHKIPRLLLLPIVPETQSNTFEIIGIIVGLLLAVMCGFYCWRVKKRKQTNKEKKLVGDSCGDANRVDDFNDQTGSPEYAVIEYSDTTHSDALNVNQGSSTPIRAPAPPPRSALPAKNTCLQLPPRGFIRHGDTNHRSGLECTHVENEYDYVYGVKKECPRVVPLNRGARKPRARLPAQE